MSDCPMLISNKLHSFRNFELQTFVNGKVSKSFNIVTNFFILRMKSMVLILGISCFASPFTINKLFLFE